jgi:hypothetical protein
MPRLPFRLSTHYSYAVSAALLIGLADAATIAGHIAGADRTFRYVPPRLWLVAPLCWVALAMFLLIPAIVIARRQAAPLVVTTLLLFGIFARLERALTPVRGVIAAVLGIAACWVVWRIGQLWLARPRPAAAVTATSVIVTLGAVFLFTGHGTEPRPVSAVALPDAPNVVIVILDTVGHDALFEASPPNVARLARASVVFDHAYAQAPWTLPSHLSAFTGIPAQSLGIDFDQQSYTLSAPTLAEVYRRRGYRTAAVISNPFANRGSGFQRGFDVYEHAGNALDVCRTAAGMFADRHWTWFAATVCNWSASEVTGRLLAQMRDETRPYFLVANYMDAHNPYYVEPRCRPAGFEQPDQSDTPPAEYRRRYYPSHLAAIACIDRDLGAILDTARRSKRQTLFVLAADHGEHFGEKGLERHGNSLYAQLLHVPLIVNAPWLAPAHVSAPVDLIQFPSIVNAAASRTPLPSPLPIATAVLIPQRVVSLNRWWSVIAGRWHLVVHDPGREELFDVLADPSEAAPIPEDRVPSEVATRLRIEVQHLRSTAAPDRGVYFRSLGYVQ